MGERLPHRAEVLTANPSPRPDGCRSNGLRSDDMDELAATHRCSSGDPAVTHTDASPALFPLQDFQTTRIHRSLVRRQVLPERFPQVWQPACLPPGTADRTKFRGLVGARAAIPLGTRLRGGVAIHRNLEWGWLRLGPFVRSRSVGHHSVMGTLGEIPRHVFYERGTQAPTICTGLRTPSSIYQNPQRQ